MQSGITLKIKAVDADGITFHEECKENDLFLWNWGVIWAQFFKLQFTPNDPTLFEFIDLTGVARTTSASLMYGHSSGPWADGCRVQIGSGSDAPTITDFQLQQYVKEVLGGIPEVIEDGNTIKVVFAATFPMTEETICAEVGVKVPDLLRASGWLSLITRDTFSPVTVPAGGSLTLQYELWFNGTPPEV